MSESRNLTTEMWTLADALLDERISAEGVRQLEAMLDENPSAQAEFIEYCQLHVNLHANVRAQRVVDEFRNHHWETPPSQPNPVAASGPENANPLRLLMRGTLPRLLTGGGLALLLVLAVYQRGTRRELVQENRGNGPAIAIVTSGSDAVVSEGGIFKLDFGTATLVIPKVGNVQMKGPARFELLAPMRARLNYGQIRMRVTEKTGHGFVVETPDGEVTDLGTEFGLHVSQGKDTSLIVHEGEVDLRIGSSQQLNDPERLVGGEAVYFNVTGNMQRLMSLVESDPGAFNVPAESNGIIVSPLILSVSDNLSSRETKGYYQIVPRGLREDALSNVGARHQWNGVDASGIPAYLLGADYVKGYVRGNLRKANVSVSLSRPAKLYVFWCDEREAPHEWLVREFKPTGDFIGLDANDGPGKGGRKARARGREPGKSIDLTFSIWVREITSPGTVLLGAGIDPSKTAVYDIAAAELETGLTADISEKNPSMKGK